jgi:hypothetical protein
MNPLILAGGAAAGAIAGAGAAGGIPTPPADILGGHSASAYTRFVDAQLLADRNRLAPPCRALRRAHTSRDRTGGNNVPADMLAQSATRDVLIEHLSVTGCGRTTRHNLMVYRVRTGGWRALALLPGNSLASPVLQRDTLTMALRATVQLSPNAPCPPDSTTEQRMRLGEIQLVRPPTRVGAPWTERINITYCGLERPFEATFTPTPRDGGTDYALRPLFRTDAGAR